MTNTSHVATDSVTRPAHAKVNLDLLVLGRRPDGYHLLDSLVYFATPHDDIIVKRSERDSFEVVGPESSSLGTEQDNLVIRARDAFRSHSGKTDPVAIQLIKRLPIASGIGGGSADAAATLMALQALFAQPLEVDLLHTIALSLGADVPVCLRSKPAIIRGIGEDILPLGDFNLHILLVNPRVSVATPAVFKAFSPPYSRPRPHFHDRLTLQNRTFLLDHLRQTDNALQKPSVQISSTIQYVIDEIQETPNVLLSRMSGSGATCFGLYSSAEDLERARKLLKAAHPDWWVA